ncbi:hypothetical protein ANDA3_0042 [plant metagenome]|uniref:Uncharacterized protein n=1 Tax=plant metagenome TaxID=1297885 RepID=A0A484QPF5_9ZZZZ
MQDSAATQQWRPLGQLQAGLAGMDWAASHASYPTALPLDDRRVRAYFSPRDPQGRSQLASLDIEIEGDRHTRIGTVRGPLLAPGARGAFDADGATVSCVLRAGDTLLAYYLGWSLSKSVPFTNFIGLATSHDAGATFVRHSVAPIVGRSEANPFTLGYPWVLREGDAWTMWFGSHLAWGEQGLEMQHVVKSATSPDGLQWQADPRIVVDLAGAADPQEFAVSRPCVVARGERQFMWYARRNPDYQIGFASRRTDGDWVRQDGQLRFLGQPEAWEDTERTYPCVFALQGTYYMLYNGNGYGRSGFGLARLENPECLAE